MKYKTGWFCVSDFTLVEPNEPGLYAIYVFNCEENTKRLIYIGTARNLKLRLKKHEIKKVLNALLEYPEWPYIKCKVVNDINIRMKTERWLIDRLQPKANYV